MTKPVLQISTNIGAIALSKLSFMVNLLKIGGFFYSTIDFRLFLTLPPSPRFQELSGSADCYAI
jgi:hypothetical protein